MSKQDLRAFRLVCVSTLILVQWGFAAHVNPRALNATKPKTTKKVSESQHTARHMRHLAHGRPISHRTAASQT